MEAQSVHPETLDEKTPVFILEYFDSVTSFITVYGWYILGILIAALIAWGKFQPTVAQWKQKYDERAYAAKYHKDPDLMRARQEAIQAARLRMQEEHDRQARINAEKAKEREEQKREQRLSRHAGSNIVGQRLGAAEITNQPSTSKKTNSSSLRPEYNPLMGPGGSGGYRPPKKGCPGGGCGKK